jgi:hypothetical protein
MHDLDTLETQPQPEARLRCPKSGKRPLPIRINSAADLDTNNRIEAILGADGLIRGYVIRGRLSQQAHAFLAGAHAMEDWLWHGQTAIRWGVTSVFGRRHWIEAQRPEMTPPAGIPIVVLV